MSEKISIILPVLTMAMIFMLFLRPEITGFVVAPANIIQADIKVSTAEGVILPAGSEVSISVGGEVSSMPISAFISHSGGPSELAEGTVPEIDYSGSGYTGNHTYVVPLSEFNLSEGMGDGERILSVKVIFEGFVISQAEEEIMI